MITSKQIAQAVAESVGVDTPTYLREQGYDTTAVGKMCARLSIAKLTGEDVMDDAELVGRVGPWLTYVALVAFEIAVRCERGGLSDNAKRATIPS